jgi:TRAP-type uncharacterized transport system substrate-binding protein
MAEDVAYQLTKTFWDHKVKMGQDAAWWKGVDKELLSNIEGRVHPGALKYYQEAGFPLADAHK